MDVRVGPSRGWHFRDDEELIASGLGAFIAGAGTLLIAAALVPLRSHVDPTNVALLLMVVVVAGAALGGRTAAVVGSVVATLSFDFFYTKPYLSLVIDSRDDVETAAMLLLGGLIVGQVATRGRFNRAAAAQGRSEIARIRRVADEVARGGSAGQVIDAATRELVALLGLASCEFDRAEDTDELPRIERAGTVGHRSGVGARQHRFIGGGFALPEDGVALPVLHRGHEVGRFVLVPLPAVGVSLEARVVAVAIADHVGAALDDADR